MNELMRLVVALEKENVLPEMDTLGAMYALEGVHELEKKGWKFIPPPEEAQ